MRKSRFISFCGWMCLFFGALGWGDAFIAGVSVRHQPALPAPLAVLFILFSGALALLWFLGTIAWGVRAAGARAVAKAAPEGRKVGAPGVPAPVAVSAANPAVPAPAQLCGSCKRIPAMVRCVEHATFLCGACWEAHHRAFHQIAAAGR